MGDCIRRYRTITGKPYGMAARLAGKHVWDRYHLLHQLWVVNGTFEGSIPSARKRNGLQICGRRFDSFTVHYIMVKLLGSEANLVEALR